MATFIFVKHGDDEQFLANADCRQSVLLDYVRRKTNYKGGGQLDLVAWSGSLARIRLLDKQENVLDKFNVRGIYIPIALHVSPMNPVVVKSAVPLLNGWEKKCPRLESTISILTSDPKMKSFVKGVFGSHRGGDLQARLSTLVMGRSFSANKSPPKGKRRKKGGKE